MNGRYDRSRSPALLCVLLLVTTFAAGAARALSIADRFARVGSGESLVAPFTVPATSTVNSYGGAVEVIVSGIGNSYEARVNDAFYGVPSGIPVDYQSGSFFKLPYYQLNIGWSNGFHLAGCEGEPNNANNFITFIEDVGPVTPPAMPAYAPVSHTYHFVVSIPADAARLSFGVSDCIFNDNGGQYQIQVFQLQPLSGTAIPTGTSTATPTPGTPTPTPTPFACAVAPQSDCQGPQGAAGISLNATARTLRWKWAGGSVPVSLSELGDPVSGPTAYALCVYDTSGGPPSLAFGTTVPSGGICGARPCWKASHGRYAYANSAGSRGGVNRMVLRPNSRGSGASIVVNGGGANLHLPVSVDGIFLLREFPEVIVQLQRGDSASCWEAVFTSPADHNTRSVFSDSSR